MAKGKIDYDTVVAATSGDALAAGAVLDYFNDFMDGLCTGFYTDADGFWDYGIDLSMKSFMQAKLLRAMLRFQTRNRENQHTRKLLDQPWYNKNVKRLSGALFPGKENYGIGTQSNRREENLYGRRNRRNAGHQRQGGLYTREERAVQVRPRRQSHSGIQKLLRQLVGTKLTDKEKIRYGSNQAEKNKVFRYLLVCK